MSEDGHPSPVRHLAGLTLVAGLVWCLLILWSSGPMLLRGTIFEDLFIIAYVAGAFGVLTLAEKIVGAWVRH